MTYAIFCSNRHLVLDAPRCPTCGWVRPPSGAAGKLAWPPLDLGGGLGGPGSASMAPICIGAGAGLAVVPMRSGAIRLLNLENGQVLHTLPVEPGLVGRGMVVDGSRILVSLCDERSLEQARNGWLAVLDPKTRRLEKAWEASSHAVSAATLAGDKVLVRTSLPELVAFDRQSLSVRWRTTLEGGLLHAPLVASGLVVAGGGQTMNYESYLSVYSLENGEFLWRKQVDDLINFDPPALAGSLLIFRSSKTGLTILDLKSRQVSKLAFGLVYSPPVMGRWLYLVARGNSNAEAADHYILQAIDPHTSKEQWRLPLPDRFRQLAVTENELILLGSDHGMLMAVDGSGSAGRELWRNSLSSREDPFRTNLACAGGLLLAGTYSGKLSALQVVAPLSGPGDPDQLLAQGDKEGAAAAFAVRGNFRKAAELFAGLNRLYEAQALYEKNGDFEQAGRLALAEAERLSALGETTRKLNWLADALKYYLQTDQFAIQGELHEKLGDDLPAARCFEKASELLRAARLFEKVKYIEDAARLYHVLNLREDYFRLKNYLPLKADDLKLIEQEYGYQRAGDIALNKGLFREAVDIYNRNQDTERELNALAKLVETSREAWALDRLLSLTRQSGRYFQEGQFWETYFPRQNDRAADAYLRAARQAEFSNTRLEEGVATLYEKAQNHFLEAGLGADAKKCAAKVSEFRHSPVIEISFKVPAGFTENGVSKLDLSIANVGWGKARKISFSVDSPCFKFEKQSANMPIRALASGGKEMALIYIRACSFGPAVPLNIRWDWEDENQVHFSEQIDLDLPVSSKESNSAPQPIIYNSGTIIQAQNLEKAVVGENFEAGAQKGDKVVIGDGSSPTATFAAAAQLRLCPHCGLPQELDAAHCNGCGKPLPA